MSGSFLDRNAIRARKSAAATTGDQKTTGSPLLGFVVALPISLVLWAMIGVIIWRSL